MQTKNEKLRNMLFGGISAIAASAFMQTSAVAAEARGIYGIYDNAIASSGDGGTVSVFEADKTLTLDNGSMWHGTGSSTIGIKNTDYYSKVWLNGGTSWTAGAAGVNNLGVNVVDTNSILTTMDNTGTVIFLNNGGVDRDVGSSDKALKHVQAKSGVSGAGAGNVWTYALTIDTQKTFAISGLGSSNGGSTKVSFNNNGTLLISQASPAGAYVRMSATATKGGTAGMGQITIRSNGIGDIVLNGLGDSTNYLRQVAFGSGTQTRSTGSIYSATTIVDTNETAAARVTGNGSKMTLGNLVYFIDYNTANETALVGNINNGSGTIDVSNLTVGFGDRTKVGNGLTTLWDKRAENDDAVNLGKVLQYGDLTAKGQTVQFNGQKYTGSGTTYMAARALPVQKTGLAAWNFALAEQGSGANTTAGDAYLLLVRNISGFTDSSSASGLNSGNFGGIADAMNKTAGNGTALGEFLDGLTVNDTPVAAQQMVNNAVNNQISETINGVAEAANNAISSNIGGAGTGAATASRSVASGINSGDVTRRNNAWAQIIGSWNRQDRRNNVDGYTADTYGFSLGGDTLLSEATRAGVALHYANTSIDGLGVYANNRSRINTYGITLYGQHNLSSALFLDGRLGYAYNDITSDRFVTGLSNKAKASYGAHQIHASARIGYDATVAKNTTLTPHLGLGYTYLGENSYTESGNIAALHVGARNTNALTIGAGVRGKVELMTQDRTKIVPELRVGAYYDTLASSLDTTARFVDGGVSFTTRNIKPDPWTAHIGAGVNVISPQGITLTANYDAALREKYAGHTGSLRAKIPF